jgi:hypothetical protein
MARAGGHDKDHIGFVARGDDEVGRFAVELRVQDRAVPKEVP